MADYYGVDYLKRKLGHYELRGRLRYKEYDQKYEPSSPGITIPAQLREQYKSVMGWCSKAVNSLADRLVFREFAGDNFEINEIFRVNNSDIFFDSSILSALITSCCFIYVSRNSNSDIPRLQIIDGTNATGILDPITGLLWEGYAVLARDKLGNPYVEAYFLPDRTIIYENGRVVNRQIHTVGYPLLVPVIHRPDASRPFGRSRISRSAMYYQQYAKRTIERADVTAEFYSFPQKYVTGLSQDAERMDSWKATVSAFLSFTRDKDGNSPQLGQFTTSSMSPFTEQLRTAASLFAGETGLTLDDLGFVRENPSSSEAIKASHETLRVMAKKAQRCFASGFLNVGYVSACLRDEFPYRREQFSEIKAKWEPIFEPDASTIALVGDGAIKLNKAVPGYFDNENVRDLTGIEAGDGIALESEDFYG
ncbi:MAG: hypothetical protein Q4E09_06040 [Eubacteriales bacterium]|nr:hypothetical protein [Eubacteriales bacterium]